MNLSASLLQRRVVRALEQWAVEVLCGVQWTERENSYCTSAAALVAACEGTRGTDRTLGVDSYCEKNLSPSKLQRLRQIAISQCERIEWLDRLVAEPDSAGESDQEALNAAWNSAYSEFRQVLLSEAGESDSEDSDIGEADVYHSTVEWRAGLWRARQLRRQRQDLAALMWPPGGSGELVEFDFAEASIDDVAAGLCRWAARHSRALVVQNWEYTEARSGLLVWLSPSEVSRQNLASIADKLTLDRGLSRATRYAALRMRDALGQVEDREDGA